MNKKLRRKLAIVWANGNAGRYVAKASPNRLPGSGAWDVYDTLQDKFLNPREVMVLSDDQLSAPLIN